MHEIEEKMTVENLIYEIRGKQVILDSDLAKLYQCANGTKSINLAVSRNKNKFPDDFIFQLTKEEFDDLKFQNETSKENVHGGVRKLPFVFTEQGIAMLATVLHTSVAAEVSIKIMRAFVHLRKYFSNNLLEQRYINELVIKDNKRINLLEESFSKMEKKKQINEIYFNGQIYDAYSKIIDILTDAKKEIILIDNYADKSILDMISKVDKNVVLITKENNLLKEIDIEKYNKQYHNLKIIYDNTFHDRYIILDNKEVYHCGASINYAGSKTFSINKIEDEFVKKTLIDKILLTSVQNTHIM